MLESKFYVETHNSCRRCLVFIRITNSITCSTVRVKFRIGPYIGFGRHINRFLPTTPTSKALIILVLPNTFSTGMSYESDTSLSFQKAALVTEPRLVVW